MMYPMNHTKYAQPQVVAPDKRPEGSFARWIHQCRFFAPYARAHQRWLWWGIVSAMFVVGCRLILPWPLRMVIEPYLQGTLDPTLRWLEWIPQSIHPVMAMGILFVVVLSTLGLADLLERLFFARFSIGTVRDLRAHAFKASVHTDPKVLATGKGDLVARLIGDTARIKAGLKGLLVHVATNGATFVGVIIVLLWLNISLGLIFALAGLAMMVVTSLGASRMRLLASKYRKKEGKLANSIHRGWQDQDSDKKSFSVINESSGNHEASLTRIQGMTTWASHAILGLAVLGCLWAGTDAVEKGTMQAGDILIVMMYALMLRGPIIQLTRQGVRTGKIIACGERLERLIQAASQQESTQQSFGPLQHQLEFVDVRLKTAKSRGKKRLLGPLNLTIPSGQHVAVIGQAGSGKSLLLEMIAGYQNTKIGSIRWDGTDLSVVSAGLKSQQIAYLPQSPTWLPRSISDWLRCSDLSEDRSLSEILKKCGLSKLIRNLPRGLNTKVGSEHLSNSECKALALVRVLRLRLSVMLLDDPAGAMKTNKARSLLSYIHHEFESRTVVVCMNRSVGLDDFDRVLVMDRGRIVFDDTPEVWCSQRKNKSQKNRTTKKDKGKL